MVTARTERRVVPTYPVGEPEKNPMFFEKRVYQGSSGRVYPVPFIDRVFDEPRPQEYESVRLENELVRIVVLPEIGGRIFLGQDKANSDYDFFYRQDVVKPALVGLAGPWVSGGVEFNWPQHHRPGTFMPSDFAIEEEPDGARTVWLSEHDPITRMKGMHGVRLRPGSAVVELRVRLFNRTPLEQTFLWWANVAARVHDRYQSFFPPDVHYVADHAVRAQSSFPIAENDYYGVDYAARPGANDLSWYKNIPVPTSYMVCETAFDFFGGYDHAAGGGFVHVADRHVAPGKKQWTWGNHEFGWAWDRELTDDNGPYIELMAGVYTDNQPDFSYLAPYETKTFSQFWWPYQGIGPVQNATRDAAVRLVLGEGGRLDLGAASSRALPGARVLLTRGGETLVDRRLDLAPGAPWRGAPVVFAGDHPSELELSVFDAGGERLVAYRPLDNRSPERTRTVATEPPAPAEVATSDQLYLTAEHLEQYRHPTRSPVDYWEEALRRDPDDSRVNTALGRWRLGQGDLRGALTLLERAVARLTERHPNPCTGEAYYFLGVVRQHLGQTGAAGEAYHKATWNHAWRAAGHYALATLACRRGDLAEAVRHCEASLDTNRQNNKANVLKAIALRSRGLDAGPTLDGVLATDPLDHWARHASGDLDLFFDNCRNDAQTVLDVAYDYADAGFFDEAVGLLHRHHERPSPACATPNPLAQSPLTHYALAWLLDQSGDESSGGELASARRMSPDYLFPSRLHDQLVLEWAASRPGADRNAWYGLGNYRFDRRRHEPAIEAWESARDADPAFATVHRNLGIAYWNVRRDAEGARRSYARAAEAAPDDPRIFYEHDQLRKKIGDTAEDRLDALLARPDLVDARDDCSVELAALYNERARPAEALELLLGRRFHPWEGGEGRVLEQHKTARLKLGQAALERGDAPAAVEHFRLALTPPENLGEAYHLLQAKADVNYWLGKAHRAGGDEPDAVRHFRDSAEEAGDFRAMAVTEHSELSYYRGLSLLELDQPDAARALFEQLAAYAERQANEPAAIDYFATSLPLLLVFDDDLDAVKKKEAAELARLARDGLARLT